MLAAFVVSALASFVGAVAMGLVGGWAPAAHIHLAFAVGVMPLILAAMTHFAPVLTRSSAPDRTILITPLLATAAGVAAFFSFTAPGVASNAYYGGAVLGLAAVAAMAGWMFGRGRYSLGAPHPGLDWYLAALACLMLALLAVLAMAVWPEQRLALRRFHLHLNVLGFVGLTAIGTLQVLLPTAAGRPDGQAASRLRSDLKWALSGALLVAIGAGWLKPLAWFGLALWLVPLARLGLAWATLYRAEMFRWHGAVPSLAAAWAGFVGVLLASSLHAMGGPATGHAHALVAGFLFPLVSGAASQLLPVWLRPGPQTGWHQRLRTRLTNFGGLRALLFLSAGLALALGAKWGWVPAAAGLGLFAGQVVSGIFGTNTTLNEGDGLE